MQLADERCIAAASEAGVARAAEYRAFLAVGANEAEGYDDAARIEAQ